MKTDDGGYAVRSAGASSAGPTDEERADMGERRMSEQI
jgi:hypothetical protein